MGVVYRAWDTRLHRAVALKFLPERVASDPHALERLRREARAASGLNHPNICTVYDLGEDGDSWFIAMEMLEGKTLQERLASRRLRLPEFLDWSIQLANALDVAHSQGIVHRDLKPSNIFITDRGLVKILDFGLAKTTQRERPVAVSATQSMVDDLLTTPGSAVGTVPYMSPEQALGEEVDSRTDLFSLGAVMYEMITGHRAFTGDSSAAIFNSILNEQPVPASRLNPECSPALDQILFKALEKDRELRYQVAAELRVDLKRLERGSDSSAKVTAAAQKPAASRLRVPVYFASALIAVVAIAFALFWYWPHKSEPVSPGEWVQLTHFSDYAVSPAISDDGRLLAFIRGPDPFITSGQIYIKTLPDGEPVELTHDNINKLAPTFSPDGSTIAYSTCCGSWDTWSVPVFGGPPHLLFANASALKWIDKDHLLFSEVKKGVHMGLMTANADRTNARNLYLPEHERGMVHYSALSKNHKWVLIVEMGGDGSFLPCRVLPFDGSSGPRQVGPNAPCTAVAWSPDGKWMYFTAITSNRAHIWRQKFPDGTPEPVTSGPNDEDGIAFAPDGKSFVTSVGLNESTIWIHTPKGDRQISSEASASQPEFAPDGSRVYYLVSRAGANGGTVFDLWSSDLSGNAHPVVSDVATDPGWPRTFAVSPDGRQIVFAKSTTDARGSHRVRLWLARTDNRSSPQEISSDSDESDPAFAQDGALYYRRNEGGKNYFYRMNLADRHRERVISSPIIDMFSVSRDGSWASLMVDGKEPESPPMSVLHSLRENRPDLPICTFCAINFSWDGKLVYIFLHNSKETNYSVSTSTLVAAAAKSDGNGVQFGRLPGAKLLPDMDELISASPDLQSYAFSRSTTRRNLYRIPVR